jgi:hypothetical protein
MSTTLAYKQMRFWDVETGEDVTSIGLVWKLPNGQWQAQIYGGWFVAQGASKESAKNKVLKLYHESEDKAW